jgi:hypothetical protein
MVTATGGAKEEICTTNWVTTLNRIGATAFGSRNGYPLSVRPDLAAPMGLEVLVDGVLVPELSSTTPMVRHWSYDLMSNTVSFEAFSLPPASSTISVRYLAPCVP